MKPQRARPIDHLRDERGLVAIGHRIDHALLAGSRRKQRAGEHIRLDTDHDDMLFRADGSEGMRDRRARIACCLDDNVHIIARARIESVACDDSSCHPFRVPPDGAAGRLRTFHVAIRDEGHLEPLDCRNLGKEHRSELASADKPDTDGFGLSPRRKLRNQAHERSSLTIRYATLTALGTAGFVGRERQ